MATEADISAERLLAEHWIPSRPIKLTDSAKRIGAVQRWSLDWLAAKLGDRRLTVNVKREQAATAKDTEKHHVEMSVAEFARRAQSEVGNALYVVSRNGVLSRPEFADLWADVTDLPAFLAPPEAPVGVSLWMGPAGTVTPPHFDPHNVLLVQVQGRKRVRLAPRLQAHQHDWLDGYYLDGDLDSRFGDGVLTVELGPGESLFVPVGWFHEVTALDPSMTLSFLCFPWPNHFHWLGPPGSDDARS